MNDWPEAWSDDNRGRRYGHGSASAQPEGARVMRQVRRGPAATPPGQSAYGGGVPQQPSYVNGGYDDAYGNDYNTGQVYGTPGGGGRAALTTRTVRGPGRTGDAASSGRHSRW